MCCVQIGWSTHTRSVLLCASLYQNLSQLVGMVRTSSMKPSGQDAIKNTRWMVVGGILAVGLLLFYLHAHHPPTKGERCLNQHACTNPILAPVAPRLPDVAPSVQARMAALITSALHTSMGLSLQAKYCAGQRSWRASSPSPRAASPSRNISPATGRQSGSRTSRSTRRRRAKRCWRSPSLSIHGWSQ